MKKSRRQIITGALAACVLVFLSGPRIDRNETLQPLHLPESAKDLPDYLSQRESQYTDLVPGTEKTILWAGEPGEQTEFSLVFLHGFSASHHEIAPIPETLAKHLQANLFLTRFTGHGRGPEGMREGNVNRWLNDANEALQIGQRLGKKVIVMAVSTGGSAATWLAAQPDSHLHALILVSPNYGIQNKLARLMTWPWGNLLLRAVQGPYREWQPLNKDQATYWTWRYPSQALLPMMGMITLTEGLAFEDITTPTLMIYHPEDQVVDSTITDTIFQRLGSTHKHRWVYTDTKDPDKHVLMGDIVSPGSTAAVLPEMLQFLQTLD